MKTVLEINTSCNYGSTGRIVEQIGILAQQEGWQVHLAHGTRYRADSQFPSITTDTPWEEKRHILSSALFDKHGLGSAKGTGQFINHLRAISPDIVHLHNIHGYYLNYPLLFHYLDTAGVPVVWTLHDCWPFTGHCSYFDRVGCENWKSSCHDCPGLSIYPRSLLFDRSEKNFIEKRNNFTTIIDRLQIVTVSHWLEDLVRQSFLKEAHIRTIHNGIDTKLFTPKDTDALRTRLGIKQKKVVLGVALPWSPRKGLDDMLQLADHLPDEYQVILIGLSGKQRRRMPPNVIGIGQTRDAEELATYYSLASVFVNPTYEDNFPTTNLEALACGTPVVTYRAGGSPEAIDPRTGIIVEKGDFASLIDAVLSIRKEPFSTACRNRAVTCFDKDLCFSNYIRLYEELLTKD